ncbi:MAG: hypothetical protein ACK2UV_10280, partial [Candidatus Promineifilaceae bacterium]
EAKNRAVFSCSATAELQQQGRHFLRSVQTRDPGPAHSFCVRIETIRHADRPVLLACARLQPPFLRKNARLWVKFYIELSFGI